MQIPVIVEGYFCLSDRRDVGDSKANGMNAKNMRPEI